MKFKGMFVSTILLMVFLFVTCKEDDPTTPVAPYVPTSESFTALKAKAIESITTVKSFNAEDGLSFTSTNGVIITLPPNSLKMPNGDLATGPVDLDYKELFTRAKMLTTNRTTMGLTDTGDKALLKSGGAFYLNVTQGTTPLELNGSVMVVIPTTLTGGVDSAMVLWQGVVDEHDNLAWEQVKPDGAGTNGGRVGIEGKGNNVQYISAFSSFGWTNVDRFYSDPRPKTTLLVEVPSGYDNTNSAVYLSYDGEGNSALANLDTYDSTAKRFSEHYGQIPIGLQMHVIFASEESGQWRYAIKAVTVSANDIYTFSLGETTLGTQAAMEAAVSALP